MEPLTELRRRAAATAVPLGSAAALLSAAAVVTAFAVDPPTLGWVGFGVVSVVCLAIAAIAGLAFPRLRAEAQQPVVALDGEQRLLVVADSRCSELVLRDEIEARLDGAVAVHLVVPVRVSPLHYLTDDEGEERREAKESLLVSVRLLQQRGLAATGSVGGDDPLEAMTDALAWFPATRVLLATPPDGETYWLEHRLLDNERALTSVPVAHVVVPSTGPQADRIETVDAAGVR